MSGRSRASRLTARAPPLRSRAQPEPRRAARRARSAPVEAARGPPISPAPGARHHHEVVVRRAAASSSAQKASRSRRLTRLRSTAPPTRRPTDTPSRTRPRSSASARPRQRSRDGNAYSTKRTARRRAAVAVDTVEVGAAGEPRPPVPHAAPCDRSSPGPRQTVRRERPFLRRRLIVRRPARVRIRARNPCVRARLRFLGWYVRFIASPMRRPPCAATARRALSCRRVSIKSLLQRSGDWPDATLPDRRNLLRAHLRDAAGTRRRQLFEARFTMLESRAASAVRRSRTGFAGAPCQTPTTLGRGSWKISSSRDTWTHARDALRAALPEDVYRDLARAAAARRRCQDGILYLAGAGREARVGAAAVRRGARSTRLASLGGSLVRDRAGRRRRQASPATRPWPTTVPAPQVRLHVRGVRDRRRQPLRPCRRAGGRRAARPGLQPAVPDGPPGVGKTHLLQAIGNYVIALRPAASTVRYATAETFTSDFTPPLQRNQIAGLQAALPRRPTSCCSTTSSSSRARTRPPRSSSTRSMRSSPRGAQVVLSADRPPSAMPLLHSSLKDRFEAGLLVDLDAAGPRHRACRSCASARRRGRRARSNRRAGAARAADRRRNVRALEGALIRVARLRLADPAAPHPRARRARALEPLHPPTPGTASAGTPTRSSESRTRTSQALALAARRPHVGQAQPSGCLCSPGRDVPVPRAHRPLAARDRPADSAAATTPPCSTHTARSSASILTDRLHPADLVDGILVQLDRTLQKRHDRVQPPQLAHRRRPQAIPRLVMRLSAAVTHRFHTPSISISIDIV